jgi:hypothetical protein
LRKRAKRKKEEEEEEEEKHTSYTHSDIYTQEVSAGKFDYILVLLTTIDNRAIQAIYVGDARL